MRIQHNIAAMNSYRNFQTQNSSLSKNLEKLSSGYKINRAGDDAAGLAISEKMRAQITGLAGAQKNAKDGISLVQTAEGALQEVHDMLNRMYSLAEQSANGTYSDDTDRSQLQKEVTALREEINRIADSSNFNGTPLLDGDLNAGRLATGDKNLGKITLVGMEIEDTDNKDVYAEALGRNSAQGKNAKSMSISLTSVTASKIASGTVTFDLGSMEVNGTTVTIKVENASISNVAFDSDGFATVEVSVKGGVGSSNTSGDVGKFTFKVAKGGSGETKVVIGSGKSLELQIGDTGDEFNKMKVNVGDVHAYALGLDGSTSSSDAVDISTQSGAASAMDTIKKAIDLVSDIRGGLGALQNRLDHTINNLGVMQENIQNAESTIRDTDVADEMMAYTKNSILNQAAQAMLAQANQLPQGVLQLLQ